MNFKNLEELFSSLTEADTVHKNNGMPVDIVNFPTIHRDDSEPLTIIWPDINQGPWIAGGACLRWYQGQPVGESDIDVFCANAEQAQRIINEVKSYGRHSVKFQSDNVPFVVYVI